MFRRLDSSSSSCVRMSASTVEGVNGCKQIAVINANPMTTISTESINEASGGKREKKTMIQMAIMAAIIKEKKILSKREIR